MKVVLIAGGWHFPKHFYDKVRTLLIPENFTVDFVAVCHRNMTEELFKEYKVRVGELPNTVTGKLDKVLYRDFASVNYLKETGWQADLYDNTVGDFNFINQWLDTQPPTYDMYIYLSDDIYLTENWKYFLIDFYKKKLPIFCYENNKWVPGVLPADWVHIGNCPNPGRKVMRSSTGIFTGDFIKKIGKFSLDNIDFTRGGLDSNLWNHFDVEEWNLVQRNLQNYLEFHKLDNKSFRLSSSYRTSKYMIEAERGLISHNKVFQHSYLNGIKAFIDEDNIR